MKAYHPNGDEIIGTLETIQAVAKIAPERTETRGGGESLSIDYTGETDLFWDNQETVRDGGERVFITDDGAECKESEVILK